MMLEKIVSGGQTGADRAGLEAAYLLNLKTGGWAPPSYITSAGKDFTLKHKFGLQEIPWCPSMAATYARRSQMNVDDSDATVAFRYHPGPGTDKTIGYCMTKKWMNPPNNVIRPYRPVLIIKHSIDPNLTTVEETWMKDASRLHAFLRLHNVKVLNIAGHRSTPEDPAIQQRVLEFLAFSLYYFIHS